eukprot:gene11618-8006_t
MSSPAWNLRGHGPLNTAGAVSAISFDPELEMLWVADQYGVLSSYTMQSQAETQTFSLYSCFSATGVHSPEHIGFYGSGLNSLVTIAEREAIRFFKRGGVLILYQALPQDTQPFIDHMRVYQPENTIYYTGTKGLTQMRLTEDSTPMCQSVPYENTKIDSLSVCKSYVGTGTGSGTVVLRDRRDLSVAAHITASRSGVKATELKEETLLVSYTERSTPTVKIFDLRNASEPLYTLVLTGSDNLLTGTTSIHHFHDSFAPHTEWAFVLASQNLHLIQLNDTETGMPVTTSMPLDAEGTCFAVSPSCTCAALGTDRSYFTTYGHPLTRNDFIMSTAMQPPRPVNPGYMQSWAEADVSTGFDETVPEDELASRWPEPHYMILTVPQKLHCVEKECTTTVHNQWGLQRSDSYLPDRKDNLAARIPNPYPFNTMLGEDPTKAQEILLELRREQKRKLKLPPRTGGHGDDYAQMDEAQIFYATHHKVAWKAYNEIPHKVIGVDNSYPECWLSSLLQCLFLCQPHEFPIRKIILRHLCRRQYCVTCEISFIFSNMLVAAASQHGSKDSALPPIVQMSHLLRTMAQLPAFDGIFDKPKSRDDAVAKIHACQRALLKQLHRDLQDQRDYPFMNFPMPSDDYRDSIATYFGTEFQSSTAHRIDPRFYWEVPGSALKVDEGLQHLLKEMERSQEKVSITRLPLIIVLLLNPEHSHLKPPLSLKISKYNGEDFNYMLNSNVIHLADDVEDIGNFVSHQRIKDDTFCLVNDYRVTQPMPMRDLEQLVPALRSYTAVVSYYALSQLTAPAFAKNEDNRARNMWEVLGPLLINDIFATPLQINKSQQFRSPLKSHLEIKPGQLVAIDAEYVVLKWAKRYDDQDFMPANSIRKPHMALARVSCILSTEPGDERTIMDDYVHTPEEIEDYVTKFSGIRPGDLDAVHSTKSLTALKATYLKLRALVDAGVIFVGHGLAQDFRVCNIVVPKRQIIDTLLLFYKNGSRYMSLKFLAYHLLNEKVQEQEHDSIEDARTSLRLYRAYEQLKANGTFEARLDQLLKKGAETNWYVPSTKPNDTMIEHGLSSPLSAGSKSRRISQGRCERREGLEANAPLPPTRNGRSCSVCYAEDKHKFDRIYKFLFAFSPFSFSFFFGVCQTLGCVFLLSCRRQGGEIRNDGEVKCFYDTKELMKELACSYSTQNHLNSDRRFGEVQSGEAKQKKKEKKRKEKKKKLIKTKRRKTRTSEMSKDKKKDGEALHREYLTNMRTGFPPPPPPPSKINKFGGMSVYLWTLYFTFITILLIIFLSARCYYYFLNFVFFCPKPLFFLFLSFLWMIIFLYPVIQKKKSTPLCVGLLIRPIADVYYLVVVSAHWFPFSRSLLLFLLSFLLRSLSLGAFSLAVVDAVTSNNADSDFGDTYLLPFFLNTRPTALGPVMPSPAVAPGIQPLPPGAPRYKRPYVSPAGVTVSYEEDFVKQHHLECDGLCLHFYQMLQKKVVGREQALEPVCIPETVVFEHNFPQAWFSYDEENHELIKKPGKMLDAATMFEFFSMTPPGIKGPQGGTVVAQFLHISVPIEAEWANVMTRKERKEHVYAGQHVTYVEFFTAETLNNFLFGQHRKPNGVLQRFVVPKGQGMSRKNMQIQMIWTPAITAAHMRVNRFRIDDGTVPFSDRLSTYDGAPHLSQELIVADETKNSLDRICKDIAEHFHRTEKKRLSRLLLYFKTDDMNRLWLMWCGGLRVEPDALSPNFQRVPLMLHMRKEILDKNTTTINRLENRRRRQKQLLSLDYELFNMTQDTQFAMTINNTHRRQAKSLNMRGIAQLKLREGHCDPRRNPNHPLHESFIRICDDSDMHTRPDHLGRSREEAALEEERSRISARTSHLLDSELDDAAMAEKVQKELVALAMDSWYAMYSSTLSLHPNLMPTSQMEIAPPLASAGGVLHADEQEELTRILRISRDEADAAGPAAAEAAGHGRAGAGDALERYRADEGVLGTARRLDRPSAQVQREVELFFDQLFQIRGSEIVDRCLEDFGSHRREQIIMMQASLWRGRQNPFIYPLSIYRELIAIEILKEKKKKVSYDIGESDRPQDTFFFLCVMIWRKRDGAAPLPKSGVEDNHNHTSFPSIARWNDRDEMENEGRSGRECCPRRRITQMNQPLPLRSWLWRDILLSNNNNSSNEELPCWRYAEEYSAAMKTFIGRFLRIAVSAARRLQRAEKSPSDKTNKRDKREGTPSSLLPYLLMEFIGGKGVELPLRTNTPRVDPTPKRRGYTAFEAEIEKNILVVPRAAEDGEQAPVPRLKVVRVPLVPWDVHAAVAFRCSLGAAALATVVDIFALWRGVDPSASHGPAATAAPHHVVKPEQMSSWREALLRGRHHFPTIPHTLFRSTLSYGSELGLFIVFRHLLRRAAGLHSVVSRADASSASSLSNAVPQTVTLTPSLAIARHVRDPEVWCGLLAGAAAGAACAAVAHPYRVLDATSRAEPRFRTPMDVLRAGLAEQPAMLRRGLRQGFAMATVGGAMQCGVQFGGYQMLREDGVYRHPVVFFLYCYVAVLGGALCRYPCLSLRQHWHQLYMMQPIAPVVSSSSRAGLWAASKEVAVTGRAASAHAHPQFQRRYVSYWSVLDSLRRNGGITRLYDGFFASRPMLRAVPTAGLLYMYDSLMRSTAERLHPGRRAVPQASQSLTAMLPARRPLPAYDRGSALTQEQMGVSVAQPIYRFTALLVLWNHLAAPSCSSSYSPDDEMEKIARGNINNQKKKSRVGPHRSGPSLNVVEDGQYLLSNEVGRHTSHQILKFGPREAVGRRFHFGGTESAADIPYARRVVLDPSIAIGEIEGVVQDPQVSAATNTKHLVVPREVKNDLPRINITNNAFDWTLGQIQRD